VAVWAPLNRSLAWTASAAAAVLATTLGLVAQSGGPPLEITHHAREVAPGEVVRVEIATTVTLRSVQAEWLRRTVRFYEVDSRRWEGLAPIDLADSPGPHTMLVVAATSDGRTLRQSHALSVGPHTFPVRRLTVPPEFATPPPEVLPRIEKERREVEAIVSRVTPERLWTTAFVAPVPGEASSSFGRRSILNGQLRSPHSGTDFHASTGTPVVSPNRGRVALVGDHYFSGRTIIIDHGLGLYSYLAHLSEVSVAQDQIVERGQQIALSGSTGRVTGPHLHWTVRLAGARVDALSLLSVLRDQMPHPGN
jgi:murein DD-endopeptidase MepM/ murein hydrolase activator NlpD